MFEQVKSCFTLHLDIQEDQVGFQIIDIFDSLLYIFGETQYIYVLTIISQEILKILPAFLFIVNYQGP
jgi:hypothetical protein